MEEPQRVQQFPLGLANIEPWNTAAIRTRYALLRGLYYGRSNSARTSSFALWHSARRNVHPRPLQASDLLGSSCRESDGDAGGGRWVIFLARPAGRPARFVRQRKRRNCTFIHRTACYSTCMIIRYLDASGNCVSKCWWNLDAGLAGDLNTNGQKLETTNTCTVW